MAEGGPPDLECQKNDISDLMKLPLKKGDTWYLLDIRWFKQWKKYVGYDSWDSMSAGDETINPGPIDNSALFKGDGSTALKEHMVDELDYVLMPVEAWNKLVAWYGIVPGQEPIGRKVIEQGMFVKHCRVEVYLMDLKLSENSDLNTVITKQFSRAATIEDLENEMRKVFNIDENREVRLWNRYMSNTYEHLCKKDNTLQDAGLYQGQVIVVEQKNEDSTWPRQAKSTSSYNTNSYMSRSSGYGSMSSSGSSSMSNSYNNYESSNYSSTNSSYLNSYEKGGGSKPGLCGLANLGNTCFMNSALQCMSNVPALTEYMLSNRWEEELNRENPLGMKGEIAISFAELVREMWSGTRAYTVPRSFKIAVGRFAPQFSGYQQQDSQELMAFLLDGLHEDLNRIRKKPYIELKDGTGREDAIVAQEAWDNYKKRNDSIIVDIFHGLLKSTVQCPDCDKISVTFDPFCYLSLPMPIERPMEVFWVPLKSTAKPVQFKLTVPKDGSIMDLCKILHSFVNVPAEKMVVTDVYNHRFHKIFQFDEGLNHILDRDDIFIYEVPHNITEESDYQLLPVYFRELKQKSHPNYMTSNQLFGQPLLMAAPHNCTYDRLYNLLLERMERFVRLPEAGDVWWKDKKEGKDESNCETDSVKEESWQSESKCQETGDGEDSNCNSDVKMETDRAGGDRENKECIPSTSSTPSKQASTTAHKDVEEKVREDEMKEANTRIFSLTPVNSYGSSDSGVRLEDNDKPLKLTNRTYLAIDWSPLAKEKFYIEKSAEEFEQHDTVKPRLNKRPVLQLNDCLRLFTEAERLSKQDPWYCPECRKHKQATKKFDLWSLPQYLIIHLKRFSYNRYWRDKIDALVEFPTQGLDLRKYIINPENREINIYDLIAVTNHYGGLGGGHYTAFAKNKEDGEWYYFDDSNVSNSSEESVVTKAAYVLVYQRRKTVDGPSCSIVTKTRSQASATATSASDATAVNGFDNSDDEMDTN